MRRLPSTRHECRGCGRRVSRSMAPEYSMQGVGSATSFASMKVAGARLWQSMAGRTTSQSCVVAIPRLTRAWLTRRPWNPRTLGLFDVIHCFGLLYHLDSPIAALRIFESMCRGLLILETMVCDSSRPLSILADETLAASQALEGMGCRPSRSFLTLALNRVGFAYVYGAAQPPVHPDFQFDWRDNLDTSRNGNPLRCVVVASRTRLDSAIVGSAAGVVTITTSGIPAGAPDTFSVSGRAGAQGLSAASGVAHQPHNAGRTVGLRRKIRAPGKPANLSSDPFWCASSSR